MTINKFVLLLSALILSGCSLMTSSKTQTFQIESFSDSSKIFVEPFIYKTEPEVFSFSSSTMPTYDVAHQMWDAGHNVSATYEFDEKDQTNLFDSITSSLKTSGATVVENSSDADKVISISFNRLGMHIKGSGMFSSAVVPYFDAEVKISDGVNTLVNETINVEGPKSLSMPNSKNTAIKDFVQKLADLL